MSELGFLYVIVVVLASSLAVITIWSRRRLWPKVAALVTATMFLPIGYVGLVELLGRPKPVSLEHARAESAEANVVGSVLRENVAIYLWLELDDDAEPLAYALPWNQLLAQELFDAENEAAKVGKGVRMRLPFRKGIEEREERVFYAAPQAPRPAKQVPADTQFFYDAMRGRI